MKNKLLLSTLSVVILTALSSSSLAQTNYQDSINSPYDYPEHTHEDNRSTFDIQEAKARKYANIATEMAPIIDTSISALETLLPIMQQSTVHEPSGTEGFISTDSPSHLPVMPPIYPDERIQNNTLAIDALSTSIADLNHSSHIDKQMHKESHEKTFNTLQEMKNSLSALKSDIKNSELHNTKKIDDEIFKSEVITTSLIDDTNKKHKKDTLVLNTAIEKLKVDIKDSDEATSLLIKEAERKSKSHADSIMRNQQTLNTERFNKLDQQNTLYKRQFKQFNSRLDQMESKINQTARDANAGIASVAAMTNIPYTTGTRFSAGLGMGNFKNGKAIAAGAQYQIKQNLNVRSSVSWNNSDSAVIGAGVAYGW